MKNVVYVYNQNRVNAAVIHLRARRLSYNQIASVMYMNVKTVHEKVQRAVRNGTFKNFDNRRLPRRIKDKLSNDFKRMKAYWSQVWDFVYGAVETIEEAFDYTRKLPYHDDEEDSEEQEEEPP